jgi:hypothetical protein
MTFLLFDATISHAPEGGKVIEMLADGTNGLGSARWGPLGAARPQHPTWLRVETAE